MGYAKELGKQYNAGTAWASLGTDQSAYDKSYLANTLNNFREISIPGFTEYTTSGPRQFPFSLDDMNSFAIYANTRNNINTLPLSLSNIGEQAFGLLENIKSFPDAFNQTVLAGKYINRF